MEFHEPTNIVNFLSRYHNTKEQLENNAPETKPVVISKLKRSDTNTSISGALPSVTSQTLSDFERTKSCKSVDQNSDSSDFNRCKSQPDPTTSSIKSSSSFRESSSFFDTSFFSPRSWTGNKSISPKQSALKDKDTYFTDGGLGVGFRLDSLDTSPVERRESKITFREPASVVILGNR